MPRLPQRPAISSHPSDENLAPTVAYTPASNPVTPPPSRPTPAPPSTLGKRHRDSTGSELTDALEDNADPDKDLARRGSPSYKKKAKFSESDNAESYPGQSGSERNADANVNDAASTASGSSTIPPIGTPLLRRISQTTLQRLPTAAQQVNGDPDAVGNKAGPFGADGFLSFHLWRGWLRRQLLGETRIPPLAQISRWV